MTDINTSQAPLAARVEAALQRLAKWRSAFAAWHLGVNALMDKDMPGSRAMRDLEEGRMFQRAEMSAMTALLVEKGLITKEEFNEQLIIEAGFLEKHFERMFPGFKAVDVGLDMKMPEAGVTMTEKFKP